MRRFDFTSLVRSRIVWVLLPTTFLLTIVLPLLALAQDGGVADAPDPAALLVSATDIVHAANSHRWPLAFAGGVMLISKVAAWVLSLLPWLWAKRLSENRNFTHFILPIVGAVSGALVSSLQAGMVFDADLLLQAILIGCAGAGWGGPRRPPDAAARP